LISHLLFQFLQTEDQVEDMDTSDANQQPTPVDDEANTNGALTNTAVLPPDKVIERSLESQVDIIQPGAGASLEEDEGKDNSCPELDSHNGNERTKTNKHDPDVHVEDAVKNQDLPVPTDTSVHSDGLNQSTDGGTLIGSGLPGANAIKLFLFVSGVQARNSSVCPHKVFSV
jgi:hypothetical protein